MAASSSLKKDLEENLTCSICLELFKEPKLLQCLHTLCKECIYKWKEAGSGFINCPVCRKRVEIPEGNASKLQDNFFVANLLSVMSVHSECKDGNASCSDCDSGDPLCHGALSVQVFCEFCNQGHKRRRATTDHEILTMEQLKYVSPSSLRITKPLTCKEHSGEKLKMYCGDCELCICMVCALTLHKDHDMSTITKAFEEQKVSVNKLLNEAETISGKYQEALKKVNDRRSEIINTAEKQHGNIDQCFDEVVQIVEERRKHMHEEVETLKLSKEKVLQLQAESLEMSLASTKSAVEFGHEALNKGSATEVLTIKKQIVYRVKELVDKSNSNHPDESCRFKLMTDEDLRVMMSDLIDACRSISYDSYINKNELESSDIISYNPAFTAQLTIWLNEATSGSTKWKRCYWAKRDGFRAQDFHSRCDRQGPTVTIVKSDKGYIFGGFTPVSWTSPHPFGECLPDTSRQSFIYSLINHKMTSPMKLPIKDSDCSIFSRSNFGPTFGVSDIEISDSANKNSDSYSELGRGYSIPAGISPQSNEARAFLAGSRNFTVSDIEVFLIKQ